MKPILVLTVTLLSVLLFTLPMPLISAQPPALSAKIFQLSTDDYHHNHINEAGMKSRHEHRKSNRRSLKEYDDHRDVYVKINPSTGPTFTHRHGFGFSFRSVPSRPNPTQNRYSPGSGC